MQTNWETTGLILTLVLAIPFIWLIPKYQMVEYRAGLDTADVQKLDYKDRVQLQDKLFAAENSARLTVAQSFGGLLVLFSILIAVRNARIAQENARAAQQNAQAAQTNAETAQKNFKLAEETAQKNLEHARDGKITERFSKAVELLGSEKLEVRLGGIYALERIARDSQPDHWTVMEVLTAFVREYDRPKRVASEPPRDTVEVGVVEKNESQLANYEIEDGRVLVAPPTTDVQAVLTVIGRRKWYEQEEAHQVFDFEYVNIGAAHLYQARLPRCDFTEAILVNINLRRADLSESFFSDTKLNGAILDEAILIKTEFYGADIQNAVFRGANLREAHFREVILSSTLSIHAA